MWQSMKLKYVSDSNSFLQLSSQNNVQKFLPYLGTYIFSHYSSIFVPIQWIKKSKIYRNRYMYICFIANSTHKNVFHLFQYNDYRNGNIFVIVLKELQKGGPKIHTRQLFIIFSLQKLFEYQSMTSAVMIIIAIGHSNILLESIKIDQIILHVLQTPHQYSNYKI